MPRYRNLVRHAGRTNHLAVSLGSPIYVEDNGKNTVVYAYRYYPNNRPSDDCTIFYEVEQATIIAA